MVPLIAQLGRLVRLETKRLLVNFNFTVEALPALSEKQSLSYIATFHSR